MPLTRRQVLKLASATTALAAWPVWRAQGQNLPALPTNERSACDPPLLRAAFLADAHLAVPGVNDCFFQSLTRAVEAVNQLAPVPDFVVFGGDLAHLGNPQALDRGAAVLEQLRVPLRPVVGEHDWYADLGETWRRRFGRPFYSFACHGAHCIVLNSVAGDDGWAQPTGEPRQRALLATGLSGGCLPVFGLGSQQLEWLRDDVARLSPDTPVMIFSHTPLYDLYAPWGFCNRDAGAVQSILARMEKVTVVHGHTHGRISAHLDHIAFCGMLSTAWGLPSAPRSTGPGTSRCVSPPAVWANAACAAGFGVVELLSNGQCHVIDHVA